MQLHEFMTRNPHGAQARDSVRGVSEQMRRHGVGALLVFEHDRLAGIITDRDIVVGCIAAGHTADDCTVREHMTADAVTIPSDASLEDALHKMAGEQVRRLVVTEDGRIAGIVSLGDLAVRSPDNPQVARALAEISEPVRIPLPA